MHTVRINRRDLGVGMLVHVLAPDNYPQR
jgi:hypothetical protein